LNATDNYANVTVYPNPTANIVNINCSDKMLLNTKALLTDVNGKQLQTISIEQINTTINLAGYSNGMYLLKLQNGQVIKLVKE
jgi:hypothetical protein